MRYSELIESDEASVLAYVKEMISGGQPGPALKAGRDWMKKNDFYDGREPSAEFYFQLALASKLLKKPSEAREYQERARHAPGYDEVMRGDFLRDQVLDLIRRYQPGDERMAGLPTPHGVLDEADSIHDGNGPKMVANLLARAKLHYFYGAYRKAWKVAMEAAELSKQQGHPDQQYDRNLRFMRIAIGLRLGRDYRAQVDRLASELLGDKEEKMIQRRMLALITLHAPKLARVAIRREERRQKVRY